MNPRRSLLGALLAWCVLVPVPALADDEPTYERAEDVVYGRKHGMALTLDVFTPKQDANGLGLIWVVSGGWFSAHEAINDGFARPMLDRGYTVFAVVHGSQPRFSIPEILDDMHRAVRYIRHNAEEYGIDPDRIGIYGGSAGCHLSLMQGLAGEEGDAEARDPVDGESSRVQAVAGFFPPTDFLNYGKQGEVALGTGILEGFKAPFDFRELDPERRVYVPITDEARRLEIGRQISPVTHVDADDPPVLLIHGDADQLVPIQQSERVIEALDEAGVEAKLVVEPGAGHGWPGLLDDLETLADWFDEHLQADAEDTPDEGAGEDPPAGR